ncbi:MAG: ArsA family ATPase [Promethearchaeota archaeon]
MIRKLLVYGGKGGVGKSSISAATAVKLSDLEPEKKILLISFDIAHNLSDLFGVEVGGEVTQLAPNLWGIEPDVEEFAREYTSEFADKTRKLMKSMPVVGLVPQLEKFIDDTFTADSIPLALKNSIIFQHILDAEDRQFDYIVADFPPTGNMLALFEIPENQVQLILKYSLEMFSLVKNAIRNFKNTFRKLNPLNWGRGTSERQELVDDILEMMNELENRGERVTRLLRDRGSLRLVTIAEKPSFEEIKRGAELSKKYISVDGIHINKVIPKATTESCPFCKAQRDIQDKYKGQIVGAFPDKKVWVSHQLEREPIGIDGLRELAREVYSDGGLEDILL